MHTTALLPQFDQTYAEPDQIRTKFSQAMSVMYRAEVPQYGTLLDLVAEVNQTTLERNPNLKTQLQTTEALTRLGLERHGAIRLGTAQELQQIRRIFQVMGMYPVAYYDLSVAGLPVHSTAFRPITAEALRRNPFRIFTSLIRLDLLQDRSLAQTAQTILQRRRIVNAEAAKLLDIAEKQGGLTANQADAFVLAALETFRWHAQAKVSAAMYARLQAAHRLIADVVCFAGPHINHLTPRTLDIDAVQQAMHQAHIAPKAVIEGPPHRSAPILLRQTAFQALTEPIQFESEGASLETAGVHSARFGEVEQRGAALTAKGRALYDACLDRTRASVVVGSKGENATQYQHTLERSFTDFPDDWEELRKQKLAYFCYRVGHPLGLKASGIEALLTAGCLVATPQTYEDFLPVSAAGIFQSNLGTDAQSQGLVQSNQAKFEAALGEKTIDPDCLYAQTEQDSLYTALTELGQDHLLPFTHSNKKEQTHAWYN